MSASEAMRPAEIRVIAICLFRQNNRILVFEAFDRAKGSPFYRPLGGGIEPGETSQEAIIREIREEVSAEITDLQLVDVIENLFTNDGRAGHEIVFVYDGEFVDKTLYAQSYLEVHEDDQTKLRATWRPLEFFNDYHRLVPKELMALFSENIQ